MDSFSWSDTVHALFSPCLSCLRSHSPDDASAPPRYDDLDALLADASSSAASLDPETLSLHSNPGRGRPRRRPKSRFPKTIRLFGYDLFGRPPIRLPEDEEDDDEEEGRRRRGTNTLSSSTLDSDAAPLDTSAIQSRLEREEQEARERAERKARRRARKEMKRAALALAMNGAGLDADGAFEGFQGSGPGGAHLGPSTLHGGIPSPFLRSDSSSASRTNSNSTSREAEGEDDDEADAADFDAHVYTRRAPAGSGSQNGSDSRSRTTTSLSNSQGPTPATYNHHYLSQAPISQLQLLPPASRRKKSKSSKSSSSKKSSSSATTSQSQSLLSPLGTHFPDGAQEPAVVAQQDEVVEFEGFPHDMGLPRVNTDGLGIAFSGGGSAGGFPSPGLGGSRRGFGKGDVGAFLARRGAGAE